MLLCSYKKEECGTDPEETKSDKISMHVVVGGRGTEGKKEGVILQINFRKGSFIFLAPKLVTKDLIKAPREK